MAFWSDLLMRLARPPEDIRAENLRHWAQTIAGAVPIAGVEARTRSKVAGVIQNIRIDPREGRNFIEASIIDGSGGSLVVRLLGRSTLEGWRLGKGLVVEGMIAESPGGLMMLNPEWDLIGAPEHG